MNNRIKKIIAFTLLVIAIIMIAISIVLIYTNKATENQSSKDNDNKNYTVSNHDNTKLNISEVLKKPKAKDGISFYNIEIFCYDTLCNFSADVTNETEQDFKQKKYTIVFFDNKEQELNQIPLVVADLKAKETSVVVTETLLDIVNAYDFKIIEAK